MAMEDNEAVFPEVISKDSLVKLAENDYWTYITQYMNDPQKTGLAEFYEHEPKKCKLRWHQEKGWFIRRLGNTNFGEPDDAIPLQFCDVAMGADPAATHTGIKSKTSRSAVSVWAMDWEQNVYLLWGRADYVDFKKFLDWIFEAHELLGGHIRQCVVESNAFQKIIAPKIREESILRNIYVNAIPVPVFKDKTARIRTGVGMPLMKQKVWLDSSVSTLFIEEQKVFPMSESRMDFLDSCEKALMRLVPPQSEAERIEDEIDQELEEAIVENVVGY
jgi:hypothetical protein